MDIQSASPEVLDYIMNHIFLPPKLPQQDDSDAQANLGDIALCQLAYDTAVQFPQYLSGHQQTQWAIVTKMLKNLLHNTKIFRKEDNVQKILDLGEGETLVFHIRAQNAALILRKNSEYVVFEAFGVSRAPEEVMATEGKLLCSYPGPAAQIPLSVAQDSLFVEHLVSFLSHMDVDQLDAVATTIKAGSEVQETRGTTDPKYITQFLIAILRGIGQQANVDHITKRIGDDVCWENARNPWRRSPLWLVLRVAVQRNSESREVYKAWMLLLHTRVLRLFLSNNFSSDLLHTARVKTSRRAYKLRGSVSPVLLQMVTDVGQAVQRRLEARWSEEQRLQASSALYSPDLSTIEQDTTMSLLKSRAYLTNVLCPEHHDNNITTFRLSHQPLLRDRDIADIYPDGLTKAVLADPYVALADFELLVQERLGSWTAKQRTQPSVCEILDSCLEQYITATKTYYRSNPEDQSLMILTILDLWVALDTAVCSQYPLLRAYSPEIPNSILDALLIRHGISLDRAAAIQRYLRQRHSGADSTSTSIYSAAITSTTFAVRYFRQSPFLQAIKTSIEQDATSKRTAKCAQLQDLNARHTQLMREIAVLDCEYYAVTDRWGSTDMRHSKKRCGKCRRQKQAHSMRIDVHEWPMPNRALEAEASVFELNCPPAFSIWRTRTYQILRDIGMAHVSTKSTTTYALNDYEGLKPWLKTGGVSSRIIFASTIKSFLVSHYRSAKIPTTEDRICVNNGFKFRLYDKAKEELAHSFFDIEIYPYCTLRLPDHEESLYRHLQYAVAHTTHTHNSTIVKQSDCPVNLSIHEQLAFSNLRCGSQLQWMNIIRELRTKVLTFSCDEVHTLLMQAAWQMGPLASDGFLRYWHTELGMANFGFVLIQEATELLSHVSGNWMEVNTVKSIIYLTSRLLASATDSQVHANGYTLLREARKITHYWMREILDKLQDIVDNNDAISALQRRVCEIAATCRATFDVNAGAHLNALLSSSTDVAILVECANVIHDNAPRHLGDTFSEFQKLLRRDRRLSHFLEPSLMARIRADRQGLDTAISSIWPRYRPGDEGWQQLSEPNSRWVTILTDPLSNQRSQRVHYNMLSGELMIDGKSRGRLPQEIVGHSIYKRILGQKNLDVIPADMPGMDYATRFLIHGYQLFFRFRDGAPSPTIRARGNSGQIFELIPHNILAEDFPYFFTADYVHWMDIDTGKVEFRPLDRMWQHSSLDWHLNFSPNGPSGMFNGDECNRKLIDIRSPKFQTIAACLRPLEHADYLTIISNTDCQSHLFSIELPRFRLSFFLNSDNELESNSIQDMVIDSNQCTGTMIGLTTQLVLRHKDPKFASLPRSRLVLIPHGDVHYSISPSGNHICVDIDTRCNFRRQVTWYKYEIDSDLGLLVDNGSLTSHLFKIYLHALCSHPLPDPLTVQRGTDYALQELAAARSFSFQQLANNDIELLRLIGKITPKRDYYPNHLRVMQTTTWSLHLPVLSQHGSFDTTVSKIMQYARSLAIFPGLHEQEIEYQCTGDPILMARATKRHAIYYEGSIDSSLSSDTSYLQDYSRSTGGEIAALKTSRLVSAWPVGFAPGHSTFSGLFQTFKGLGKMKGLDPQTSLTYSKEWLRLDLSAQWLSIYELCRQIDHPRSKFKLIFSFAALAYGNEHSLQIDIPILLACATIDGSLLNAPPQYPSYDLRHGFIPLREQVLETISSNLIYRLEDIPATELPRQPNENSQAFEMRLHRHYKDNRITQRRIDDAVDRLMAQTQRPCFNPRSPFYEQDATKWFRTEEIMNTVKEYFASCSRNSELWKFASRISSTLQQNHTTSPLTRYTIPSLQLPPRPIVTRKLGLSPTLEMLLSDRNVPSLAHSSHRLGLKTLIGELGPPVDTTALANLIAQFKLNHHTALHQLYRNRLEKSRKELHAQRTVTLPSEITPHIDVCVAYHKRCQTRMSDIFSSICVALAPSTPAEEILKDAGLWPLSSRRTILQLLCPTPNVSHPAGWSEILIVFAEAFIEYQHSQRLVAFSLRSEVASFFKELVNASFNHSDARKNPDWLLIQIQGNFITRPIQFQVAAEMIAPSSGHNIVLQLNMGEGKSHVIVPLVAAALADSEQLVRVVVLKPLARQMFQLLVERMSGLSNRRIFYLPFSRDVKVSPQVIRNIRNLFEECVRVRGILVAQPEHILSFRLMVIEQTISSKDPDLSEVARDLHATQGWLNSNARDILDESDELLHVRYQLIYTMDHQQPLDDGPDRWTTTQQIFDLVRQHMKQLHKDFPEDVELFERHTVANEGNFPHFRLVGISALQALISWIAEDALNGTLENLIFVGVASQPSLRSDIFHFITIGDVDLQTYRKIKEIYGATGLWKGLLLLRGLLAHGILSYALSRRRWRVDYGLDLERSLLAVPYKAKDVPTLRSEFGHPDIIICLTCLSYYYGGLTFAQVGECFELVNKLDNPSLEYERWVKRGGDDIPLGTRQLIGVNMKDVDTFTKDVIPVFQRNKSVIDFYLSHVVFPKEAKEFPSKLGTSGWDLAETKANFTTGFSGTNDNSDLLPISITQNDPINQLRTNAQVLEHLLRPENDRYLCARGINGQPCSAMELLGILVNEPKEIRVLLDVGAQMLEMTNRQLIEHWLSLTHTQDVVAGVFFDDSDNLSVLTRDGLVESLHSSPFLQRLYQCIIYLDDVHTRGTDLKLPPDFRALVTLGPKVTKDKLVQGCMRMRNLGNGQSVVFCAPPEVDRQIRRYEKIGPSITIQVTDVLSWAMSNTCTDIQDHIPNWVQQGVYFHTRQVGNSAFSASEERNIDPIKKSWLQPAARDLDEMYGLKTRRSSNMDVVHTIPAMHERLKMLGITEVFHEPMAEEQEREVSHEVEQESQLERPPPISAAVHKLDEEVRTFVRWGIIPANSKTFLPLMAPLRSGSNILSPQNPWSKSLLATRDFMNTTAGGKEKFVLTEYLRPVNWIVSHIRDDGSIILVVMSPYEVNILLDNIRQSRKVFLHVYAPRTSQSMKSFNDLAFYCIPPLDHVTTHRASLSNDIGYQLNIWAGQLYFDTYETYLGLCLLLGISYGSEVGSSLVESDRFVPKRGRTKEMAAVCLFDKSPLPLLKTLFGLRRKGMGFQSTHMGKVLQARVLLPDDFEEASKTI